MTVRERKKRLKKIKWNKIKYKIFCVLHSKHEKFIINNDVFYEFGENNLYQPDTLPNNPKLIKIHNNVKVASGVTFWEHDVINSMFQNIDKKNKYRSHLACIEIYDNVFIGAKSMIIGNVKIGPNAIVGAGSVVTKNVEEGTIVAGNPAKVIGKFADLQSKRVKMDGNKGEQTFEERYEEAWKNFS